MGSSGTGLLLLVLVVCGFAGTGTRFRRVRLLALLDVLKHPWSLRGPRGYAPMGADGWVLCLLYDVHQMLSLSSVPV